MSVNTLIYKNINLSYIEKGKGNAIVFLHGFLENASMWDTYIDYFATRNRVIAIDLLGHGKTESLGYVHSMEDMADAVYAIISSLKLKKVTLIGHSMGGYVSLAFGELYPELVKKIILIASTTRSDSDEKKVNRSRSIELIKKNSETFVKMAINNLFTLETRTKIQDKIDHQINEALKTSKQGIVAALEGMKIRVDREVLLHFAPYPIKMIFGTEDSIMPYEEVITQTENTDIEVINIAAGHMIHLEAPDDLLQALKQLIKS
ncbi:alpha/beta fold hydrolase [Myroides injenensis]|uniref:alpha/beta fold hydrolase n=1 Tax=Myroides injenensis TaxID=1183151 RepID=UPI000288332F|nr:alpha/beta hydrolase [Myroides injenensis]